MFKRGQVTIFIILGIVVLAILAFVFYIGDINVQQQLTQEEAERFVSVRLERVNSYVEGCVEANSWTVLKNMGRQGGRVIPDAIYYDVPLVYPGSSIMDYSLIKKDGTYLNYNPSVSDMEAEFEVFMDGVSSDPSYPDGVGSCLEGIKDEFDDSFSNIVTGDFEIDARFEDKVRLYITYPVTLTKDDYETTISEYFVEIPVNMREIHEVSNRLINSVVEDGDYYSKTIQISNEYTAELEEGARDDLVYVSSTKYINYAPDETFNNENNIIFTLEYDHPQLTQNYIFRFLVGTG